MRCLPFCQSWASVLHLMNKMSLDMFICLLVDNTQKQRGPDTGRQTRRRMSQPEQKRTNQVKVDRLTDIMPKHFLFCPISLRWIKYWFHITNNLIRIMLQIAWMYLCHSSLRQVLWVMMEELDLEQWERGKVDRWKTRDITSHGCNSISFTPKSFFKWMFTMFIWKSSYILYFIHRIFL